MKASWKGIVIAESDNTVLVEGNHYFPVDAVKMEYLIPSTTESICHWKGLASYYSVKVNNAINEDAAWYYAEPKEAAKDIKGRIAFWKGIEVFE